MLRLETAIGSSGRRGLLGAALCDIFVTLLGFVVEQPHE
jgi:hypothetical protein